MPDNSKSSSRKAQSRGGKLLPALCNVLGTLLLVGVIVLCVPLAVPAIVGYQTFEVMSGSMEPQIPVGSAVYVKQVDPTQIEIGDVVAYQDESGVVVHRVTANRTSVGELVTKGDANNVEDFAPIPYDAVIGRVEAQVPILGTFMAILSSFTGKVYLLLTAACGVMLNLIAGIMVRRRREREEAEARLGFAEAQDPAPKPRKGGIALKAVVAVLLVVFLGSGGVILYVNWQYGVSDARYGQAVNDFTGKGADANKAPIEVDFASLRAKYPDVVGWLYCEGTPINYPVVQRSDNDFYLSHDYTGDFNINGAIFVDSADKLAVDSKAVVYGHHMKSGSMFASLLDWADQDFYDKHPVMWLLTPDQNYKVVLFSGHHTDAHSNLYTEVHKPGDELDAYLVNAKSLSDFTADVRLDSKGRYIMLSTCAYLFDDDRYVLHGMLMPVSG